MIFNAAVGCNQDELAQGCQAFADQQFGKGTVKVRAVNECSSLENRNLPLNGFEAKIMDALDKWVSRSIGTHSFPML